MRILDLGCKYFKDYSSILLNAGNEPETNNLYTVLLMVLLKRSDHF